MPDVGVVTTHYTHGSLIAAIRSAVQQAGTSIDRLHVDDLAPLDEFHIGGRRATQSFFERLAIAGDHHVLDVGCGLGGSARFAAHRYGCRITGVDLTQEYVETGNVLCEWVGLHHRVRLHVENAIALPHPDDSFDRAYLMHVGMNIADKNALVSELYRVIRPGGNVGIYDVMLVGEGDVVFPVPWATDAGGSSLSSPAVYHAALNAAGFKIVAERNRRDFALEFFSELQANVVSAGGPPRLGLHILMGDTASIKVKHMIENVSRNLIAPVELIAQKAHTVEA